MKTYFNRLWAFVRFATRPAARGWLLLAVALSVMAFTFRQQGGSGWSAETAAMLVSALLSVLVSYVPGFNEWFAALAPIRKRLLMLSGLALFNGLVVLEACTGLSLSGITLSCDQAGIEGVVRIFFLGLLANQSAYGIVQQPAKVRELAAVASAQATEAESKPAEPAPKP